MSTNETVAVLGAGGTMGFPMAQNLARAGIDVRAWNRSSEKAQPLEQDGATVCSTPQEAAQGAQIVLTMLSHTDAVVECAQAALAQAGQDTLWLQMSTIGEQGTERCIELARELSVEMLDAPVLGTKQPAQEGKLVVLASGPERLRERVQPLFEAIAIKVLWIGELGAGTRMKLVANSWVLTVTEGVAETFALARGLDIDPALLFDALEGSALDLPYFRTKGKAIIEQNFEPMFRLVLAAKDARLVDESAERHHVGLPLFHTIAEQMTKGAEQHGDMDMSATYLTCAPSAATA